MSLPKQDANRIVSAINNKLEQRQIKLRCPACANGGFVLLEGYSYHFHRNLFQLTIRNRELVF